MSVTIVRITAEVDDLAAATAFYSELLGIAGTRHHGARHYFDCGGVMLAVLDISATGAAPVPHPKSLTFAVDDVDAVHGRAQSLWALSTFQVHGAPAGDVLDRPWGERSFYVTDRWGNQLCFVQAGTLFK